MEVTTIGTNSLCVTGLSGTLYSGLIFSQVNQVVANRAQFEMLVNKSLAA